eukprot:TRINITY_DN46896_c0_g1_i1.p1 TRINITY_DN46896_c0_g1~~TRINITY_DN46896_c0_g1_i1.p1  ORF type:complete len:409 (+),score=163.58 TRINITY_DN46896_c0_g1_i1:75-1229(+)
MRSASAAASPRRGSSGLSCGLLCVARLAPCVAAAPEALREQRRFKKRKVYNRRSKMNGLRWFQQSMPRWIPMQDYQIRSDEWKRRALRNHFPEVWLRHTDWAPSLEHYRMDPEYLWAYYQQAHRQMLYNHPDDYTGFIEEVLEHCEIRPEVWVPRALRVFEDLKQRYGASARHHNALIQVFGRARFLKKAEEAFAEIGRLKMPYVKENYLSMARAYILCRHFTGEEAAMASCKRLYDDALRKELFLPPHISSISFPTFYESLKRLGSELDRKERKEQHARGELPQQNWDNKTLWHNIKPYPRVPKEWMTLGHPLNRVEAFRTEWKGVKPGDAYFNQEWVKYGYPNQVKWIERWQEWRKQGGWKPWDHEAFRKEQFPSLPGYAYA